MCSLTYCSNPHFGFLQSRAYHLLLPKTRLTAPSSYLVPGMSQHCYVAVLDWPPPPTLRAHAPRHIQKRLGGSGIVSVPGTTGHISRRPGARPTSTADPFPSQPYTDTRPSCGWFGWRTTPLVDSRGSPIVASVESQQDESARQMHGLRDDVSVDDSAAGEGGARGNYAVLLSYIHQTRDAELLWRDQTTSVRGTRKDTLLYKSMPLKKNCAPSHKLPLSALCMSRLPSYRYVPTNTRNDILDYLTSCAL